MAGNVTIKDVARLAGVSPATVSLALSGDPRVNVKTRKLVKEAAERINYIPNEIGRSLRLQRTETVALIIPNTSHHVFSHPYYSQLLEGITEVLNSHNYNLLLSLNPSEKELSAAYDKVLRNRRADGVIVSSASAKDRNLLRLIESGFPLVYLGKWLHDDLLSVERDDLGGAYTATAHLLRLGRRRIAHISGPLDHQAGFDRLEGYRKALSEYQVAYDPSLVIEKDFSQQSGYEAALDLISRNVSFDAVFAANDLMAIGALKLFKERAVKVPEDVALVGFDDIELASFIQPALTTIHQPMKLVGTIAASKLLALLAGKPPKEKQTVVPTDLVIRESCGAR